MRRNDFTRVPDVVSNSKAMGLLVLEVNFCPILTDVSKEDQRYKYDMHIPASLSVSRDFIGLYYYGLDT